MLAPLVGQLERKSAAVVGVGLAVDQPCTNERVNGSAHRWSAALNLGSDLVECGRLGRLDRCKKVALLTQRLCRGGIATQQFDKPSEARRNGAR